MKTSTTRPQQRDLNNGRAEQRSAAFAVTRRSWFKVALMLVFTTALSTAAFAQGTWDYFFANHTCHPVSLTLTVRPSCNVGNVVDINYVLPAFNCNGGPVTPYPVPVPNGSVVIKAAVVYNGNPPSVWTCVNPVWSTAVFPNACPHCECAGNGTPPQNSVQIQGDGGTMCRLECTTP